MSKYQFNTEHWPIVAVELGETTTDEEHDEIFRRWEVVFARRERFVGITDTRRVRDIGSAQATRAHRGVDGIGRGGRRALLARSRRRRRQRAGARGAHGHRVDLPVAGPERYVATVPAAWDFCIANLRAAGTSTCLPPWWRTARRNRRPDGEARSSIGNATPPLPELR